MNEKPYEIIITTSYGLNVQLTPRTGRRRRYFSNFMSYDESEKFIDRLRHAKPAEPQIIIRGNCVHCGRPCFVMEEMFKLTGRERYIHAECLTQAMKRDIGIAKQAAAFVDPKHTVRKMNFDDPPEPSPGYRIRLADNGVVLISIFDCGKRPICNAYLSPEESAALAGEMEDKLRQIKQSEAGQCYHCGKTVRVDQTRYALNNGGVIHGLCMDGLLAAGYREDNLLPATKIPPDDRFGFIRAYGERRYV